MSLSEELSSGQFIPEKSPDHLGLESPYETLISLKYSSVQLYSENRQLFPQQCFQVI